MVRYDGDIVGIEPLNLVLLKVTFGFPVFTIWGSYWGDHRWVCPNMEDAV